MPVLPIGSKNAPTAVGDIVFADGTATPQSNDLILTNYQKSKAIAVIFYVGTDLNNGDDTTTSRTLGVGLVHNQDTMVWCNNANASKVSIETIHCSESERGGVYTFTGTKNGSENLSKIASFLTENSSTDDTATERNYPAFYYAKNYKNKNGSHVSGTKYESGWYLPSIAELFQIWKSKGTVNAASNLCGASEFVGDIPYWSSTQWSGSNTNKHAYCLVFDGYLEGMPIDQTMDGGLLNVCAIREFQQVALSLSGLPR